MSFASEVRKGEFGVAEGGGARKLWKARQAAAAADAETSKRVHRLSVLGALLTAGIILGVFNSGGLVQYAYSLSESAAGIRVLEITESWHELMREQRMTIVVERIREAVTTARASTWRDLGLGLSLTAENEDADDPEPGEAGGEPLALGTSLDDAQAADTYLSAAGPKSP